MLTHLIACLLAPKPLEQRSVNMRYMHAVLFQITGPYTVALSIHRYSAHPSDHPNEGLDEAHLLAGSALPASLGRYFTRFRTQGTARDLMPHFQAVSNHSAPLNTPPTHLPPAPCASSSFSLNRS